VLGTWRGRYRKWAAQVCRNGWVGGQLTRVQSCAYTARSREVLGKWRGRYRKSPVRGGEHAARRAACSSMKYYTRGMGAHPTSAGTLNPYPYPMAPYAPARAPQGGAAEAGRGGGGAAVRGDRAAQAGPGHHREGPLRPGHALPDQGRHQRDPAPAQDRQQPCRARDRRHHRPPARAPPGRAAGRGPLHDNRFCCGPWDQACWGRRPPWRMGGCPDMVVPLMCQQLVDDFQNTPEK